MITLFEEAKAIAPPEPPSPIIIEIFGKQIGNHSRSAIGVAGLPMNFAIEIEGELEIE